MRRKISTFDSKRESPMQNQIDFQPRLFARSSLRSAVERRRFEFSLLSSSTAFILAEIIKRLRIFSRFRLKIKLHRPNSSQTAFPLKQQNCAVNPRGRNYCRCKSTKCSSKEKGKNSRRRNKIRCDKITEKTANRIAERNRN